MHHFIPRHFVLGLLLLWTLPFSTIRIHTHALTRILRTYHSYHSHASPLRWIPGPGPGPGRHRLFSTLPKRMGQDAPLEDSNTDERSSKEFSNLFHSESPVILASGSFTRKLILSQMNIPFQVLVRPIDEKAIGDRFQGADPQQLVLTLAKAKAEHVLQHITSSNNTSFLHSRTALPLTSIGRVILTADQVVTHNGLILEKPQDLQQATDFVQRYAIHPPSTVGAVVITHWPSRMQVAGVHIAHIHFKPSVASCDLIARLVQDGAPVLDCAGGLMIEHPLVQEHVDFIEGTQDSVMGLSKDLVYKLFRQLQHCLFTEAEIDSAIGLGSCDNRDIGS